VLSDGAVAELLVRIVLGAVASFLAIVCWTRTRSLAWMLVIVGILASYVGTLYRALRAFGLFAGPEIAFFGTSLGVLVSENLPLLCFIAALFAFLKTES
jgi:hypothetical protein